jgi:hypothetical protein
MIQNPAQLVGFGGGVKHHKHRTRLQDGKDGKNGLNTIGQKDRDTVAALDAGILQSVRQTIGFPVDFAISKALATAHQRYFVWKALRAVLQKFFNLHDVSCCIRQMKAGRISNPARGVSGS